MQKNIKQHNNPMSQKRPFIKKSHQTNTSLISKPNLSITKASHRFSLDNTFICSDRRNESYVKTAHNKQQQTASPQVFMQEENSFSQRLSLGPDIRRPFKKSARMRSSRGDNRMSHKQKLREILQSIDLNNSIIQQLFEQEEQTEHFKQQINNSFDLIINLEESLQIKTEIKQKQESIWKSTLEDKIRASESGRLSNKVEQLRRKRQSFIGNERKESQVNPNVKACVNRIFT